MEDFSNKQIGRFKLISPLGVGGFNEVYLGKHIDMDIPVAIKILTRANLNERDRESFRQEVRIIAKLQHKNIVKIFYSDIEHSIPFLVMQYAPNGTLDHSRLSLSLTATYLAQLADALQYAHSNKIIHCDIKPENILLGAENEVLLSDFGIAIITHTSTPIEEQLTKEANPKIAGTLRYMAPEQIHGPPCNASDQYALGIVVYEWLCGTPPFTGQSPFFIVQQHLNSPPPSLCQRNPEIPTAIEEIVFRALEKDPQRRFPSVAAFAQAFQNAYSVAALPRKTAVLSATVSAPGQVVSTAEPPAQSPVALPTTPRELFPLSELAAPPTVKAASTAKTSFWAFFATSFVTILLTLLITFGSLKLFWDFPPTSLPRVVAPVQVSNVIKIGVDLPLSGEDRHDGLPVLNAIELAVAQGKNSIPRYTLELDVHDDVGINDIHDPTVGAQNVQSMIGDAQDAALIGPFNSNVALPELPLANRAPIAMISPSTTSPCLTVGGPANVCQKPLTALRPTNQTTFFRITASDTMVGMKFADFLTKKVGYTTASIINDSGPYGIGFAQAFASEWQQNTGTPPTVNTLPTNTDQGGYETLINQISTQTPKPQVIFYAGQTPNATLIHTLIEQNASLKTTAFAVGGGVMNASFTPNIAGLSSGPVYAIAPIEDSFSSASTNGLSFYTSYLASYDDQPTPYAASAYDCMHILMNALKLAVTALSPPTSPRDMSQAARFRQTVITDLQQYTSYDGVTNHYSFNSNGDPNAPAVALYKLNTTTQSWQYLPQG